MQQVPAGGQVVRGGGQVRDDRVGDAGIVVRFGGGRGGVQDSPGPLQGQPGGRGSGVGVSSWCPGRVERLGQGQVVQVAGQRRDQAIELPHDTALRAVVQLAAERHRRGDVLACCETADREAEIRGDIAAVDAALAAHQKSSLMTRSRHPGLKGRLSANRTSLANELAQAAAARRQAVTAATAAGADPAPRILPDAAQTAAAAERARRGLALAVAELGALQRKANRLTQHGLADPADETLAITEHQRWVLYEGLPDLRAGAQEAQRRHAAVQRAYDEASEHLHRQRQVIAREIISDARLVATTLTQLTLRPWLTKADFDHVVVDEAAAAPLPHIAHAVGYAMTGAVLVGDYLQNGPIVDKSFPGGDEVRDLFETNCFSFFDATDPRRAQQTEGCVVLTEQFRFGPALTELANLVAYDGASPQPQTVRQTSWCTVPPCTHAAHQEAEPTKAPK
jgi:AAA domain